MIKPTISIKGKTTPAIKIKGKTNASIIRIYPELENLEITPTLEDQKFKSEMYGFDEVNVKGVNAYIDEDIKPEYIKEGIDILGVVGNFKGIDTSDATATAADMLLGKTAYVKNQKIEGTIQDFTGNLVIIKDNKAVILNTKNKRCIEDIAINVETEELNIIPTAEGLSREGLFNKIVIAGDEDFIATNIKKGVTIFNLEGEFDAVDTRDATVTVDDVIEGKTVYVNNQKVEGTIPNNGELEYSPSDEEQPIPSGLTSGGTVKAADITTLSEYEACLTLANSIEDLEDYTDTTATAEDIREGKIAYVNGERVVGTLKVSSELPFAELEYIENSNVSQYIDTKVQALSTIGIEIEVQTTNTNSVGFFGAWENGNGLLFGQHNGYHNAEEKGYYYATSETWKYTGVPFDLTKFHKFIYDPVNSTITVDETIINVSKNTGIQINMWLFRAFEWQEATTGVRISNCKIYDNGNLIRDYIPVKRNIDGLVCMYDKIYGEYALNGGTGSFIAGPEKGV